MADALCGPSNALQSFQKHTSVDRTLQQDRLTSRQSPQQGFRSTQDSSIGLLDPEFDAFQAGHTGPPQSDLQFHARALPNLRHDIQAAQPPDWASDFQRLNIASPQSHHFQHHAPQASHAPASWHQDFIRQQQASSSQATMQQQQQPTFSIQSPVMPWAGSAFQQRSHIGVMNGAPMSDIAQGKQRMEEQVQEFDNAAFEKAFENVQNEMMLEMQAQATEAERSDSQATQKAPIQSEATEYTHASSLLQGNATESVSSPQQMQNSIESDQGTLQETDPVLLNIRDKRLPVYMAIKLRSAVDLGQLQETRQWLNDMEGIERSGRLTEDASEARWCVESLEKVAARATTVEVQSRAENLIAAINQRLMSQFPLLSSRSPLNHDAIMHELEAAGYNTTLHTVNPMEQQPDQAQKEQPRQHDDDEMAETAGKLLERVADNTSEKFQNSQFLELMRRLRDREVRVQGDTIEEVSTPPSSAPAPTTSIPEVDPGILNHSALDFGMPIDSGQEYEERAI